MQPKYKRILLKLSGEALAGKAGSGLDFDTVLTICQAVKRCAEAGVQVGIVVGGGNFWRGRSSGKMDRTRADHMGMLATAINALGLADALEQLGCDVRVQTAIAMNEIAEPYIRNRAVRHLEKGRVVIFACGTGSPFFSTDTAAVLRAAEIDADVLIYNGTIEGELTSIDELVKKNSLFADFQAVKSGQVYTTGSNFYQQSTGTCDFIEDLNQILTGEGDGTYRFLKKLQ